MAYGCGIVLGGILAGVVVGMKKPFTPDQDATIIAMWPTVRRIDQISHAIGRGVKATSLHAINELCLPIRSKGGREIARYRAKPTREQWVQAATKHAINEGVRPSHVMAGDRKPACVRARKGAWREVLSSNPAYSVTSLANVSGFDYTTILYALGRLGRQKLRAA